MKQIIMLLLILLFACTVQPCNAQEDTTFVIDARMFPSAAGSPGNGYPGQNRYYENPIEAKSRGFNIITINPFPDSFPSFFTQAYDAGVKIIFHGFYDDIKNIHLMTIGSGQSSIYECEVNANDCDANFSPNFYYVNSSGRDTSINGAYSVYHLSKNCTYFNRGRESAGRIINGVKSRFPAYSGWYPFYDTEDTTWFEKDIKEQELPHPAGNVGNYNPQLINLPHYATFRMKLLEEGLPGSAVVCTLHVELVNDTTGLPINQFNEDTTHWYKVLTVDSLSTVNPDGFCEKAVRFYKDTSIIYDIEGIGPNTNYDALGSRPRAHTFRYSVGWNGLYNIAFDRITVEDSLGRGVRINDADVYAVVDRMINTYKNKVQSLQDRTALKGWYTIDEPRGDGFGTFNILSNYFKTQTNGFSYANLTWANFPYTYWPAAGDWFRTDIFNVHSYRYFLADNPDSGLCPALSLHVNPFGAGEDSTHNHFGGCDEDRYQIPIWDESAALKSARIACKINGNRKLYYYVQANSWLQPDGDTFKVWSRYPTCEEIKIQVFHALCYGAKGIGYYYYASDSCSVRPPTSAIVKGLRWFNGTNWYDTPQMDTVESLNNIMNKIGPTLMKINSDTTYECVIESGTQMNINESASIIKSMKANTSKAWLTLGLFSKNDDRYFMIANRRTTNYNKNGQSVFDTSRVSIKFNYPYPFKLKDMATDQYCDCIYSWGGSGKIFPSREDAFNFTVLLNPGEGRFYKIEPYYKQTIDTTNAVLQPVFDELYGVDYVKASNTTITGNRNVKFTTEKTSGYIELLAGFGVDLGSTFYADAVAYQGLYVYPSSQMHYTNYDYSNPEPDNNGYTMPKDIVDKNIPTIYALSPNYPNPSIGSTMFKYQLPQNSDVKLRIYNIAGQLVKEFNMGMQSTGYYSIKWDCGTVAKGVYLYRLTADNYTATRKMVVVR